MITIALMHAEYDKKHLEEVKKIMEVKGAPTIRAIWSDMYGIWLAIEGCHRIRAAKELGLTPIIKDVSNQKTVTCQLRGENVKIPVSKLREMLHDTAWATKIMDFETDEDDEA
ncbi:MAG TPA: hypothetical protein PLZ84_08635 [Clostridia bacterium]|nr:hypothetical protein [Clostridia bacterium]